VTETGARSGLAGVPGEKIPGTPVRERRSRRPWETLLLLVLGTVAALVVGEAAVRVLGLADPRATGYAPVKTKGRGREPTNSREYRDLERTLAKPAGTHRIVSLGDSIAWGFEVEFEDAYPNAWNTASRVTGASGGRWSTSRGRE